VGKQINTKPEVRRFKIADLEFADYNPRVITDEALAGLTESLERFELLELPVVNVKRDPPRVVGGHQRLRALQASGYTHADCIAARFDETAERAANLSLNNTATQGHYDPTKIGAGLDDLRARLPKPNFARFEEASKQLREQAARLRATGAPKASDSTAAPEGEEPDSKVGKVYVLGDHRLYCGDFADGIKRLMPKHYAHAIVTDPPYNVAYTSGKHFRKDELREPIEGDDQTGEDFGAFVERMTAVLLDSCSGPIYVFFSAKELPRLQSTWERQKGLLHRWIVVAKNAHPLSPGDYHPQYELCMLGSRRDAELRPLPEARTNVIQSERPSKNGLHPTQKPVELIRQLVEAAADVEEIVFDPFAGSGTTLAVAQDLARVCYACEIEPAYCDVIRKRWAEQVHGENCDWRALTPVLARK